MGNPTYFRDDVAIAARAAEVINANFTNGMNNGGSNAPGIGINMTGIAVVGTPEQFTLLDQREVARVAQISQSIGGHPFVPRTGDQEFTWDESQLLFSVSGAASSGGTEGVLPEAAIGTGTNATQIEKDAARAANGDSVDGSVVQVGSAQLVDLAGGWTAL
jgi:hypothetical protein